MRNDIFEVIILKVVKLNYFNIKRLWYK